MVKSPLRGDFISHGLFPSVPVSFFLVRSSCEAAHGEEGRRLSRLLWFFPVSAGVCEGAGVAPQKLNRIIGIVKAYASRVGEGPFVTEQLNEIGDSLREKGAEYGATTGRPRRTGWLDLPVVKQAVRINGITDIAITKIDILTGYDQIPVCIGYDIDGEVIDYVPASLKVYGKAKPVYRYFEGWNEDISNIRKFEDLPENCQKYVRFIEEYTGTTVSLVSVSPERSGNIILKDLL